MSSECASKDDTRRQVGIAFAGGEGERDELAEVALDELEELQDEKDEVKPRRRSERVDDERVGAGSGGAQMVVRPR